MPRLTNPATGRGITVAADAVERWTARGYVPEAPPKAAPAPVRRPRGRRTRTPGKSTSMGGNGAATE